MKHLEFIDEHGSFLMKQPENVSYLYFPLASETGLKSAVTPNLGGDAKIDQETFLLEPVSSENLHNNRSTRNFWFVNNNKGVYSASGASAEQEAARFSGMQDKSEVTAGLMWHTLKRSSKIHHLESTVTSFIPKNHNVEIMYVTVQNQSEAVQELTAYAAVPIYGRSADNIRDHRNVTSMLHRIRTNEHGVFVCPTMSFDEKGHRANSRIYYATGSMGNGGTPESFYPTVEDFIGEGGTFTHPRAVYEQYPGQPAKSTAAGKEAMGAFRFEPVSLAPGEMADYILLLGVGDSEEDIFKVIEAYNTTEKIQKSFADTKACWQNKVSVQFHTKDPDFDHLMKWICFQPFLRRLFGCSFLPHHDYGRGGRGWRDLWQDCLSLLLMEPENVGQMIAMNYGGVRIDGTNATIIGSGDGNFLADRNGIARVWMDHALWPLKTTKLYTDQTGDIEILNKQISYFKDAQAMRGTAIDSLWDPEDGSKQRTEGNEIYTGSILEHLLIQQLTAFYEVGSHNIYRLRGADWNDALDMASEHGESVAFTCAYAGNLLELASMIRVLDKHSSTHTAKLLDEITVLLDNDIETFEDIAKKHEILSAYTDRCRHTVSGRKKSFSLSSLAVNLIQKANWLMEHLRIHEWINGPEEEGWFNSYYDNHGRAVEGFFDEHGHAVKGSFDEHGHAADGPSDMHGHAADGPSDMHGHAADSPSDMHGHAADGPSDMHGHAADGPLNGHVRMMLTGQVFAIMSGVAEDKHIQKIVKSADHYLYQKEIGGYRLNTDFHELKFDMGRMFGFAYGEKENGAVFSHMTVMYANALYRRGYVKEGWKALKTLADTALDFDTSHIYPGIPEYFRSDGRGMYQYLTGAASWFMMTMITEVFGVRGETGDLILHPKLLAEQFDAEATASITTTFADKRFTIIYENRNKKDFGSYSIGSAVCDEEELAVNEDSFIVLPRERLTVLSDETHQIIVHLV